MRAGDLRHSVRVERPTPTTDPTGQGPDGWETVATVRAAVWPRQAAEVAAGGQQPQRVTHEVRTRHRADVTSECRLVFLDRGRERVLTVVSLVDPDERKRELRIMACEVTGGG